jgi:hypothetical protein
MWPLLVIVCTPCRKFLVGVGQRGEPTHVETFVMQASVEALGISILNRSSRTDETQSHLVLHGPSLNNPTGEFAPVVHAE